MGTGSRDRAVHGVGVLDLADAASAAGSSRSIARIASYLSFDEMFDHENVATVNPTATRAEQLANIRLIYPAEKEALGVIAIEVERV